MTAMYVAGLLLGTMCSSLIWFLLYTIKEPKYKKGEKYKMNRLTEYDELCGCYKLRRDAVGNAVQRLGRLEDNMEFVNDIMQMYDNNSISETDVTIRLREIVEN